MSSAKLPEQRQVCVPQFFEIDLPHASITKQKLVTRVLPDAAKVLFFCHRELFCCMIASKHHLVLSWSS